MVIRVPNCGAVGVNKDLSQHDLPINAWTAAQNIRFLDGAVHQFLGHGPIYGDPSVTPYHLMPFAIGTSKYWLYAGVGKVYIVSNSGGVSTHTDITRATGGDYTGAVNSWTSTLLGGIPIINAGNEIDLPQYFDLDITHKLVPLTNWPASTYCKALRSYKNYMVALNITKSTTRYPYMVKWSHPADPGGIPISWDHTDATKDAGEIDLAEGYDPIVDGMQLGQHFIIYKESSVWKMTFTGGAYIFSFQKILGTSGAMNRNCIVEVDGFHFVFSSSDVVVHDGNTSNSVLDKQARRFLFQNIDVDNYGACFVFKNPFLNEVFCCYPDVGQTTCNKALVWNYKDKTVSFRDIPDLYHGCYGPVNSGLDGTWEQDDAPWSSDTTRWNGADFVPNLARCLMASNATKIYMLDSSSSFAGVMPDAYAERVGLSFDSPDKIKLVRSIRPRITGNEGETVKISVGYQNDPWGPVTYIEMLHTIGQTVHNDCMVAGRYIAVKFATGTAYQWRLDSYDIDVLEAGVV